MIYDNRTLEKLSLEQLKEHEVKLISELKTDTEYWLSTYSDNEHWAYKVETDVNCLKQVRTFIARF